MTVVGWLQAIIFFALIVAFTPLLGGYMARVFQGQRVFLSPIVEPLERLIYRLCRIDPAREMSWKSYALAILAFSVVGFAYLYSLLRTQAWLPLNPQHFGNMAPASAWNTAISFLTNTNWQFYSGESTMSYLSQMAGLAWHNFVSAAVGIVVAVALIRGLVRTNFRSIGNFWVDMTRTILYVLLPISILGTLLLVWQGIPQSFAPYLDVKTLDGATQTITSGPMASQEIIKELGTNGGGFVNANSASPNENPTPLSNFFELLAIFLIPASLTYVFGTYAKSQAQGWAIFAAMALMFAGGFATAYYNEAAGNPIVHALGIPGANMEGKEVRYGAAASALFATVTTDTSCGAVNSMHDSFMPLGGLVPMLDIQLGEVVFGGVGSGFYGMIVYAIITVFVAGLMVGRTPEYLGKKIERREVVLAMLAALIVPLFSLVPAALASVTKDGMATLGNNGAHGFSEIVYAFSSGTGNNGSAFAGLGENTFYDFWMGVSMMFGRFAMMIPPLAIAGALAAKKAVPATSGTFSTTSSIFVILLVSVVLVVGALTFFPADALGPVVEHFQLYQGKVY